MLSSGKKTAQYVFIMKIFEEEKLVYEAPMVEVVEVEVEIGFAASDGDAGGTLPDEEPWG